MKKQLRVGSNSENSNIPEKSQKSLDGSTGPFPIYPNSIQ